MGTYKLAKDDIERDISEQNNMVVEKRQQVKLNEIEMAAIQQLYNLGYRGRNDVDLVRLKLLQAEDALAAATNNMQSFQSQARQARHIRTTDAGQDAGRGVADV